MGAIQPLVYGLTMAAFVVATFVAFKMLERSRTGPVDALAWVLATGAVGLPVAAWPLVLMAEKTRWVRDPIHALWVVAALFVVAGLIRSSRATRPWMFLAGALQIGLGALVYAILVGIRSFRPF